ncbi:MAG: hypothetical protein KKD44_12135 [Proteobacteria bacterium]|nr:hypothetical protein [Pseudomonadota bacterium]
MPDNLPDGILNALKLFEASFGPMKPQEQAQTFKNAVYLMNDCLDDFPIYREDILKIKSSYAVRLLCSLTSHHPNPDYDTWLEFILLFCIDLKQEVVNIKHLDAQLFEDFLVFLRLYSNEITPELKANISKFLEDITQ